MCGLLKRTEVIQSVLLPSFSVRVKSLKKTRREENLKIPISLGINLLMSNDPAQTRSALLCFHNMAVEINIRFKVTEVVSVATITQESEEVHLTMNPFVALHQAPKEPHLTITDLPSHQGDQGSHMGHTTQDNRTDTVIMELPTDNKEAMVAMNPIVTRDIQPTMSYLMLGMVNINQIINPQAMTTGDTNQVLKKADIDHIISLQMMVDTNHITNHKVVELTAMASIQSLIISMGSITVTIALPSHTPKGKTITQGE